MTASRSDRDDTHAIERPYPTRKPYVGTIAVPELALTAISARVDAPDRAQCKRVVLGRCDATEALGLA